MNIRKRQQNNFLRHEQTCDEQFCVFSMILFVVYVGLSFSVWVTMQVFASTSFNQLTKPSTVIENAKLCLSEIRNVSSNELFSAHYADFQCVAPPPLRT
ncbi:MAG: hypothetical protein ACK5L5_04315 [Bacteroidales bacterium]